MISAIVFNNEVKHRLIVCLLSVVLCAIYLMFSIKYNSRQKLNELTRIEKMIVEEEQKIRLLSIDLEHMSRPKAIRKMLFLTPNLQPIKPSQVIVIEEK